MLPQWKAETKEIECDFCGKSYQLTLFVIEEEPAISEVVSLLVTKWICADCISFYPNLIPIAEICPSQ